MTGFVLDASTAVSWAFEDESSEYSDSVLASLAEGFAVVPALWAFELANALTVALNRRRLTARQAEDFLQNLGELDIQQDNSVADPHLLVDAAREHDLTAYDAAYLELSRRTGLPLATSDRALRRATAAAGIQLF